MLAKDRSEDEEEELHGLSKRLTVSLDLGENPVEIEVERAVAQVLRERLQGFPKESIGFEIKRQLRELFSTDPEA